MGEEEDRELLTVDAVLDHLAKKKGALSRLLVVAEYKNEDGSTRGSEVIWTHRNTSPEWVMSATSLAQWHIYEYLSAYRAAEAMAKAYTEAALKAASAEGGVH